LSKVHDEAPQEVIWKPPFEISNRGLVLEVTVVMFQTVDHFTAIFDIKERAAVLSSRAAS
jgi:hypothetical protein